MKQVRDLVDFTTKSKLILRSAIVLLLKLVASALGFAFYFYLAKQLSVTEFGLFSLAMTCLLFSSTFARQGFEQATVKFTALASYGSNAAAQLETKHTTKSFYAFIIGYSGITATIVLVLLLLFSQPISNNVFNQALLSELMPYIALLTLAQTWLAINSSYLKGRGFANLSVLFTGITTLAFTLLLSHFFPPKTAIAAMKLYAIAGALACSLSFVITYLLNKKPDVNPPSQTNTLASIKTTKPGSDCSFERASFLSTSRSLFAISLAALITQQLATLVLARYVPLADVGIYSLALKIALLISYPLIAINAITAPMYARYYANNQLHDFKQLALESRNILIVLATFIIIALFLAIDYIALYFGEGYQEIVPIVKILAVGQWFNLVTGSVVSMLVMTGFEKTHRRNTLILTLINVMLLMVIVPSYGLYGAAWVTSIIVSTKNIVSFYFVNKLIFKPVKKSCYDLPS